MCSQVVSIFLIFIGFFQVSILAQANPLSLKDILNIALTQNPKILAVKEKTNQIEAQQDLATSFFLPNVSWHLAGNYYKDPLYTGSPKFGGDPYNTYSSIFRLTQTLYTRGLYSAVSYSEYDQKIQSSRIAIAEREVTQSVIEVFYRFILK